MRFLIHFSYDGSSYHGFQNQKGYNTIQGKLEEALSVVNNGKKTTITATGRTDKGVHALNQYGHANLDVKITEKKLKRALNSNLPDDIYVIDTKIVDDSFHARYQVKYKEYQYIINIGEYNPLERNYVFQYNHDLNVLAMQKAIKYFIGEHDFRAFVTENKDRENCVRIINEANVTRDNNKIYFNFKGNGFMRYQVRNMVGLLIKVGEEKIYPEDVGKILLSKDRTKSGKTAPAEGLYLVNVTY